MEAPSPEQICEELSEPLRRYLVRVAGNLATAEDLLQETLLRVARGLPGFAGRASLKTWAFAIATRVAADHFRKPAHRIRIVEIDASPELVDAQLAVDQQLVIDEMSACVRQVIDSLPEEYRAALVLHDLEGLTSAQVAEVCGCSLPTAKIRIHRARLRLKESLRKECDFHPLRDSHARGASRPRLPT